MANKAKKTKKQRMSIGEWFATLPQRMLDWLISLFRPTPEQRARRRRRRGRLFGA